METLPDFSSLTHQLDPAPPHQDPRLQEGEADASAGECDPVESPGGTERKQTLPHPGSGRLKEGQGQVEGHCPVSLPAVKSACCRLPTLRQLLEGLASWEGAGDQGGLLRALFCSPGCCGRDSPFPLPDPSPTLPTFYFLSLNLIP